MHFLTQFLWVVQFLWAFKGLLTCLQNRERELRRVSRQWRDLQSRKWFGFGHNETKKPENGDLALFCPACPQPGINLPDDWKNQPEQWGQSFKRCNRWYILTCQCLRWLFRRTIVVDGNFHADHLKSRNPEDDVALADGHAFMVETGPYLEHLSNSTDMNQACCTISHDSHYNLMAYWYLIRNLLVITIGQ